MNHIPLLPGANSPQMLTRLLEGVARGIRTSRGLQECLGVGLPTVRAYVHAGAWLGLVEATDPVQLSPLGLEYVYGGRRTVVWARAVWSNPLAAELLLGSDGRLPELAAIERAIGREESGLADATVRRRASAVRGLIAPAVGRARPRPREEEERQLALPLPDAPVMEVPPVGARGGGEHDPDVYRYVLACLLDHGELSVGHLRGLCDRAAVPNLPLGGLLELFQARGDAARVGERLVASRGAVARRSLCADTASVVLSDPGYRAHLQAPGRAPRTDALARYRAWDKRLFGRPANPADTARLLDRMVPDRPIEAFPLATPSDDQPEPCAEPFLDVWAQAGVRVSLPPSLGQLHGGVDAVNRLLHHARVRGQVGLPDAADRPVVVHGGVIHPGEPLPRSVPDVRTLRQRLIMHAPYPAMVVAALLLHRLAADRVAIVDDGEWKIGRPGQDGAPLLSGLDRFAEARGWLPIRREGAGLPPRALISVLESLGVVSVVGRTLVLAEPLFVQLQTESEEQELHARLIPLSDAVDGWISA